MKECMLESRGYESLQGVLKNTIRIRHPRNVGELAQLVHVGTLVDEDDFVNELMALVREGIIELMEPSYETKSIVDYFSTITLSGWFWASIGVIVVEVLSMAFIPDNYPIKVIRWALGSAFVLYLPGYVLIQALFPKKKGFGGLERFMLSVGASLAVVSIVGLILNYLPWGLRIVPITTALIIFVASFALVGATRKYRILRTSK